MLWVDLLRRFLAASGLEIACQVLFLSMAKEGGCSKPLLRSATVDCEREMNKLSTDMDVGINDGNKRLGIAKPLLRGATFDCESQMNNCDTDNVVDGDARNKPDDRLSIGSASPSCKPGKKTRWSIKRKVVELKQKKKKQMNNSQVIINVQGSDADCEKYGDCETEIGIDGKNGNHDKYNNIEGIQNDEHKSNNNTSSRENSEFNEKLTPMGRLIVPVRHEGAAGCGYNALFMSPDNSLHAAQDTSKTDTSFGSKLKGWLQPATSSVNMKIFGGVRGVAKEQQRMKQTMMLIHPYSNFRNYWDLAILLLLICNMIMLPITITFFREDADTGIFGFNVTSDILFMVDICLNFRTGFMAPGCGSNVVLNPKAIAKRYLKTWFFLDFLSSLPLDYIVNTTTGLRDGSAVRSASRALKFLRLVKLLSLLRLLRISRILRYISHFEEIFHMTTSFMRYIKLISMMLIVAHWNGCLNFLVPMLQDFPSDCWVRINNLENDDWTVQYSWALFKALSHMLCIGYGRFPPANLSEAYITTFSMITGATFYALFIAHSMAYLQHVDSARRQYAEKFKQIEEYMSYRLLPEKIREKLSNYYEHKYQGKLFDEEQILSEISKPLKEEIVSHNCRDLVSAVPFFKNVSPLFVRRVLTQLRFEVFLPGDYIIREGTFGTEMYFIRQGSVDVLVNSECTTTLNEGNYFGEICLLANARRILSARAASVCDLFVLPAASFRSILEEFPEVKILVEHIAINRLLELRKQLSAQTGSEEAVDKALFGSSNADENGLLTPEYNLFSRRASVRDFIEFKKHSTSIDGSTLEQLVDSHRKTEDKCKLCQEDKSMT